MAPSSKFWLSSITTVLVVLAVTLTNHVDLTHGDLTIPNRTLGYDYFLNTHGREPAITLSFYIDNTCDDSQAAYPTMIKVAEYFGPESLRLTTHLFSLPFHRNSHTIAKAAHVIDMYSEKAYDWFELVYDNLDNLTTSATADKTDDQVMDFLVPLAEKVANIPGDQFRKQVADRSVDLYARLGYKYGCTRGVYATPTFMVNDVVVSADPKWSAQQWINLLEPLIYQ